MMTNEKHANFCLYRQSSDVQSNDGWVWALILDLILPNLQ